MRDMILSVFYKCKDIEFLTLVNLLDNYIPLVLSIYSIVFKCNFFVNQCSTVGLCSLYSAVVTTTKHYW